MSEADEERFRRLYETAHPRLIAYSLRRAASREEAADVVSETLEIAWRKLEDVPASPDDLLWLYVTARHLLANSSRRLHRRDELTTRLAEALRSVDSADDPVDEAGPALSCLQSLPGRRPRTTHADIVGGIDQCRGGARARVLANCGSDPPPSRPHSAQG